MFDEAPHARDLSLLISIANFKPQAWVMSGDHRQTRPFTLTNSPQLQVSVMERAYKSDPDMPGLLINHRASGNLQELASMLFYDSKMIPYKSPSELCAIPREAMYLCEKYLMPMKDHQGSEVSRLLVVLKGGSPTQVQKSWHNAGHQAWVMKLVGKLVSDVRFLQINSRERGTILIMSPYAAARTEYGKAIRDLKKENKGSLRGCTVEARTVDTAQGHEADVCIVDLVHEKCTPHIEDPNRTCVQLTRARQSELIIMSEKMMRDVEARPWRVPTMAKIIKYFKEKGQFVHGPGTSWQ